MTITPSTQNTEVLLSTDDLREATRLKNWADEIVSDQKEWCLELAKQVEKRGAQKQKPFLEAVMPEASTSQRKDLLMAGQELSRILAGRPAESAEIPYGTSVLKDIACIPEEHRDWAYEEKRTREEIRAFKRELKQQETPEPPTPAQPQAIAQTTEETDEVNERQATAFNGMAEAMEQMLKELAELEAENKNLKQQLLDIQNGNSDQQQQQPSAIQLSGTGLSTDEEDEGPELAPHTLDGIDFNWHKGIQVGTPECNDFNEVGRLIDTINDIQHRYFCTGIWGPREWCSIYGGLIGASTMSNAQRRFRPKGERPTTIDVRAID